MNGKKVLRWLVAGMTLLATAFLAPAVVLAHCDGMDGPVVKAAQKALAEGKVNLVLIWVQPGDEGAIKTAFQKTVAVRKLSPEARELADMYFFETLVRIHRAGEGAPYTGLKAAGRDLGPVIPAADKAIADGKIEPLLKLLPAAAHANIRKHFNEVLARKQFKEDDVQAGRAYVEAYVTFMHATEGVHEDGHGDAADHHHHGETPGQHDPDAHQHKPPAGSAHLAPGGNPKEVHREAHEHPGQ
jgi:hypothetical protein